MSPPRRLVTVVAEGNDAIPPAGTAVTKEGSRIGSVTSSCRSPTFGATLALAVVERAAEEGSSVGIQLPAGTPPGTMRTASLRDPERKETRS
ncbi:MAG: glycine cleavage T C-terminal barrel domain-containing protein [Acidimicrobiia bacterium]